VDVPLDASGTTGRPVTRARPATHVVANPARGTKVAVGFAGLAAAATAAWIAWGAVQMEQPPIVLIALLAAAALAERIGVHLGPRSSYTASTPVVVLAGLLGGPLIGSLASVASMAAREETVWRRRLAEGGLGSLEGLAAGLIGLAPWTGPARTGQAALAIVAAVAINTVGRLLIMLERQSRPLLARWLRGIEVDLLEAVLVVPLLALVLVAWEASEALALASVFSLLASLTIAQKLHDFYIDELEAEQANARRDQLTGAPNRRAFEEALAVEHARIIRGGRPAGLFVVDIDRFKSINDRYGHQVGDEVLCEVFERLVLGLRATDLVARWGGEEITVLAPGLGSKRALEQHGEQIRRLVGTARLATRTLALPVTVSVGGTLLDGSVTPEAALRRADAALYDAKRRRDAAVIMVPQPAELRLGTA
jgi:diguanylate cyclase (GGDEF)-like protein